MASRDEFSAGTKRLAAERAGYACSHPDCRTLLVGPSQREPGKSVNLGIAAHIRAAAPGGPRYLGEQTRAQRRSPENCIYLCSAHAMLIDKNEGVDFDAGLLLEWKRQHEAWVAKRLEKGELAANSIDAVRWEVTTDLVQIASPATVNILTGASPKTRSSTVERVLAERGYYWPYHLFMAAVSDHIRAARRDRITRLNRIALPVGPDLSMKETARVMRAETGAVSDMAAGIGPLFAKLMAEAIKPDGESDEDLILHCADQVAELYQGVITWADRVRLMRVPDELKRARELLAQFADQPLDEIEDWAVELGDMLENWSDIEEWAEGEETPQLTLALVLTIDESTSEALTRELDSVGRSLRWRR